MMKIFGAIALAYGLAAGGAAYAATIDFDAFTTSGVFAGILTEDGFTLNFVDMYIDANGNASSNPTEIERSGGTGGTLTITKTGGGTFTFGSVDWQLEYGPSALISIAGFLSGPSAGVDTFSTSSLLYSTFGASSLSGIPIDTLVISAERDTSGGSFDNVVVNASAAVPEPSTLALLGLGLAGLVGYGWRKRRTA